MKELFTNVLVDKNYEKIQKMQDQREHRAQSQAKFGH